MPNSRSAWIGLTIAACLVLGILGWMVAISPQLAEADGLRDETKQVVASNVVLGSKVAKMRTQFEEIETYRAELSKLETKLPASLELTAAVNETMKAADASGVFIAQIVPDNGAVIGVDTQKEQPAPQPSPSPEETKKPDSDAPTDGAKDAAAASDADSAKTESVLAPVSSDAAIGTVAGETLVAVPIKIITVGDFENTTKFLSKLQTGSQRYFLVSTLQVEALEEKDASDDMPATKVGDLKVEVSAFVFTYTNSTPVTPNPDAKPEVPAPLPGSGGRGSGTFGPAEQNKG